MSLFIDSCGVPDTVFFNLFTISGEDGGLGLTDVSGDSSIMQVTYAETAGQPATADRLNKLVNTDFGKDIVITGLNGGNDPYTGDDETGNGHTYEDGDKIRVVYDTSQGCGAGMACFDTGGNLISAPNPVILYHELSHAFHDAIGQIPFPQTACPGNTTDEPAAEIDENVLRTQLGLCQRDVCNHGGTSGFGADCGGSDGGADGGPSSAGCAAGNGDCSGDGGCFIVTATTGSSESIEVKRLRRLRDRVGSASGLAAGLIDEIYREYYEFSPPIADKLEQDAFASKAVLRVAVRPLLAWYTLAGTLALRSDDAAAVEQAKRELARASARYLRPRRIVALLEAIRCGAPLPASAPSALQEFVPRFDKIARLRFVAWAILDPLLRVWTTAIERRDITDEVAQWLASAPLERLCRCSLAGSLDAELAALARLFCFQPAARRTLGARLSSAWPDASAALQRYGFIE